MLNKNYAKEAATKLGNSIERVINDKMRVYIANSNPLYNESSEDRPNFYSENIYYKFLWSLLEHNVETLYQKDDCVIYENKPYQALRITQGPFSLSSWVLVDKFRLIDIKIKEYEKTLDFIELDNKAIIQTYLIDNDKLVLSIKPSQIINNVLKDKIFDKNYLKIELLENNVVVGTKYFWISDYVNNESRKSSITLTCVLDFYMTFYTLIIPRMEGNVKVLRKHFNRFPIETSAKDEFKLWEPNTLYNENDKVRTFDGLDLRFLKAKTTFTSGATFNIDNWETYNSTIEEPKYDFNDPVWNVPREFSSIPKNVIQLQGYSRQQFLNNTTINVNDNLIDDSLYYNQKSVGFSKFNNAGQQLGVFSNDGSNNFNDLSSVTGGIDLSAWNNLWPSNRKFNAFGPNSFNVGQKTSGDFLYTFQYNVNNETDPKNIDATAGIQSFLVAQTNNSYAPKQIANPAYISDVETKYIDKSIITYDRKILNRVGNIINNKIINNDDNVGNSITITGDEYKVSGGNTVPESQNLITFTQITVGVRIEYIKYWKPYKLIGNIKVRTGFNLQNTNVSIWNCGGLAITNEFGTIRKTTQNIMLYDFLDEIEDIDFKVSFNFNTEQITTKTSIKNKVKEGNKDTYSLKEINKDNYNELKKTYSLLINEDYNEFLNKNWTTLFYKDGNWNWTNEPQLYMSHCNANIFNYLGASKLLPQEIYGKEPQIYLQQEITTSTNIDNVFPISNDNKARLTFSNPGIRVEYNHSLPSVSDSFKSFVQTNQAQINNSYLTSQNNLQYAKTQQILGIVGGSLGIAGTGIAGAGTYARMGITEANWLEERQNTYQYDADGNLVNSWIRGNNIGSGTAVSNSMKGFAKTAIGAGVARGAFNIASSVISGQKNIFDAEQQIRGIGASVADNYNTPDMLVNPSISIQEINNYYQNINSLFNNDTLQNPIIRATQTRQLPSINNLKVYSMELHKYGYISNVTFFDTSIDKLLTRSLFNYLQLGDIEEIFKWFRINQKTKNYFMRLFNSGVRLWDEPSKMLDFSQENWEKDLI